MDSVALLKCKGDLEQTIAEGINLIGGFGTLESNPKPITRPVNELIIGRNPVSVDATMARIMGFTPENIRHVVETEKYDRGTLHPTVLGERVESSIVRQRGVEILIKTITSELQRVMAMTGVKNILQIDETIIRRVQG